MIAQTNQVRAQFHERGHVDPIRVFGAVECESIMRRLSGRKNKKPLEWCKGWAAASRDVFDIATNSAILDAVTSVLGDHVMLWGAGLVSKLAGEVHPWHSDIETTIHDGGTVNVWIALKNTDANSSLWVVPGSHRYGLPFQAMAARRRKRRGEATDSDVAQWAREVDESGDTTLLPMTDGEALLFDGRLWHASRNTNRTGTRSALLLQYARPDVALQIPDFRTLEWPFRFLEARPPCIMVRGTNREQVNRMVLPPKPKKQPRSSWIRQLELPLEQDSDVGWKPHDIFHGPTPRMADLDCHVSVLDPGKSPHEPHVHAEEEILIVLDGCAELVVVDESGETETRTLGAGAFVYYPGWQRHTIRNVGSERVTYLMFRWIARRGASKDTLRTGFFDAASESGARSMPSSDGFEPRLLFEEPTRYLRKLHCHRSTLEPGAGYPAHGDEYDIAILVLDGTVETLGRKVGKHGVIFYAAGEPHGMSNPGKKPAEYLVFEFHGNGRRDVARAFLGRVGRLMGLRR